MAANFTTLLHGVNDSLFRSQFLRQDHHLNKQPPWSAPHQRKPSCKARAKFNILEMMGGRGLCNGERGLEQELKRQVVVVDVKPRESSSGGKGEQELGDDDDGSVVGAVPEDGFEKEMMGLTGGFPGGEKGLQKFIEENPPTKSNNLLTLSL